MNQNTGATTTGKPPDRPRVKYSDLEMAMSFVSSGEMFDAEAYISRKTGKIYWNSSGLDEEDDIPDDIYDSSLYAAVPHQNDLDLGKQLVLRFTAQAIPDQYDRVSAIFSRPGAYSRYKDLLASLGLLEEWYKFENSADEAALREWAQDEGFTVE
jgi:hypothetical protein